jgi:hypothetical protein
MPSPIYTNGIDFTTGTYAVPPLEVPDLDALLRGEQAPENADELKQRAERPRSLGVKDGVDVKSLAESGWAVIFPDPVDPRVEAALQPLLKLRREQAGKRYQRYSYYAGDTKRRFLDNHGVGPGPADPDRVPYYLLLAGSPAEIPYHFQAQLDVQYAVGRIHFDQPEDYAAYAASVVAAELGQVKLPRQASFFGVTHELLDPPTAQSLEYLINPLAVALGKLPSWQLATLHGPAAHKAAFRDHLGGSATPALFFSAGHGLQMPPANHLSLRPEAYQGALICADWLGPGTPFTNTDVLFAGADLAHDANLLGLIACFFACFSSGTPREDVFTRLLRLRKGEEPGAAPPLAAQPFVAELPKRMLCHPGGGALAVIGHVERAWPSSFLWQPKPDGTLPPQTAAFESMLRQLMTGYPVGATLEFLNQRYAELSTELKDYLEAIKFADPYDRVAFANTWMAANDAQWYTIIGDPAVRLPVVDPPAAAPRPALTLTGGTDHMHTPSDIPPADEPSSQSPPADQPPPGSSANGSGAFDPFAHAFTPPPVASRELDHLKQHHPDLYKAYVEHIQTGYKQNGRIFDDVRRAFMRSHNSTLAMYWLLFAIGAGTVVTAIVLALQGSALVSTLFLGVGVVAFVGYFVGRSVISVEENLLYITWLGVIYNSYWTHLAWATDPKTAQGELKQATADAISQIKQMIDRHSTTVKGRPTLQPNPPPNTTPPTPDAEQPAESDSR